MNDWMMSKKAWSPGRMRRSVKLCGCGEQRSPEMELIASTQSEESRLAVVDMQPGRVEPVVLRRAAEVPDVGVAVAGEERVARQLVARPFADNGAGGVADVVLVERKQRAQARGRERRAHPREAVVVQPPEVDALLEIDLGVPRRVQRPLPVVVRVDVVRPDDFRLGGFFRLGHRLFPGATFCRTRSMPRGRSSGPTGHGSAK